MKLSDHALRRPVTVIVATAALLVLGAVSLSRLKLDMFPNLDAPFLGVYIPYPNGVPTQMEKEIARPLEEVLATLGDLREIRSYSEEDFVWVAVEFEFGRNVDVLRMDVREKIEQVRPLLPEDIRDIFILTFNTNDIPVMVGRISSKGEDLSGSYDLLEHRVINRLRRTEGVGQVEVDGIAPKSIRIYLMLDKIVEHAVDVERLFRDLNGNNLDLSVGRVVDGRRELTVRALGQFREFDEIGEMPVNDAGVRLADVAEIDYGEPAPHWYRHINGEPAIAFEIKKASGANIVELSRRVREELDRIDKDPALEGVDVVLFFDQAEQIKNSLNSLFQSGLIGSILAVAVLFVFLRRLRPTLIVSIAIPFCVIATCVYLYLSGRTLNVLTMMGLMLAVGMLVDNAIVVLESVFRRQEKGETPAEAAAGGAREVAMAVTASTLTSVIVFAPIILSKGSMLTVWLSSVGITISVTLVFSLFICLTLVPVMAARTTFGGAQREFRFLARLRERYMRMLRWTVTEHPKRTGLVFVPLFLLVTIGAIKATGFAPEEMDGKGVKQEELYFNVEFTDNTNIYGVHDKVLAIEEFLVPRRDSLNIESVYVYYRDNQAGFGLYFPKDYTPTEEKLRDLRQYLRENLPELAGTRYRFGTDEDVGGGARGVSVTLFGEDTDLLRELSEEAARRIGMLPGVTETRTGVEEGRDEVRVVLDRDRGGRFGISPATLAQILGLTFRGVPLRDFQGRDREIEMDIVLEPSDRRNIDNLAKLPITYREGRPILLGQVARFEFGKSPARIYRERQKTALTVTGVYEGEDFGEITGRVEQLMNGMDLPSGYQWSFGRELQEARAEQNEMMVNILIALCCVYLLMAALFESFLHPLVIMLCIPFAALGVVWTMMLTATPFNLLAMIGVVILIGVVVNNGIVLIDHVNGLRRSGLPREAAILEGCRDRFRPILMTASTTILGLTPLALGKADITGGYYFPLARAVMGGLAASTILTLVVLPTFYVLAEGAAAYLRRTVAWGMGRSPLPWREAKRPGQAMGGGAPE
ncbi:MAG: efflux RND transporter permease subunit [Candidatus Eisenbacteria bacterium]|nr:efflux RND transporter permease subunit [Candidatus Eisenbacteria bacterium]